MRNLPAASAAAVPPFSAATRLMVVAPHPDDETIACGVLIQQVLAAGGAVQVLLLTAGDNNPWPQRWLERRWHIGVSERRRWGRRRQAEILEALQHLGLSATALRFLGWPDLGITAKLVSPRDEALGDTDPVGELVEALARFSPNLLALPDLGDRHPDHSAAHILVQFALARLCPESMPRQLAYLVHGNASGRGTHEVIGNDAQRQQKMTALACYHSQMALSAGRLRRLAAMTEQYLEVPAPQPWQARALPWEPAWWLQWCLRLSVVSESGAGSWPWSAAPLQWQANQGHGTGGEAPVLSGRRFAKLTCGLPSLWIFDHWGWREF